LKDRFFFFVIFTGEVLGGVDGLMLAGGSRFCSSLQRERVRSRVCYVFFLGKGKLFLVYG